MIAISSRFCAASSARPPLSYSSTDSWRCFIIFWNTPRRSASLSGGLPCPRASMSAFLMVELTIRSVESLRSSLARIASLTALLMSWRSIGLSQVATTREDHQFRAGNAVGHLHRERIRDGVILVAGQDQRWTLDPRQRRPRIRSAHDGGLLADEGVCADIVAHV